MPVVTRLQARKQRELFDRLGLEIIQKGGERYLGNSAALFGDNIDWREWVLDSLKRNRCPYR